jgi:hypothetical protein
LRVANHAFAQYPQGLVIWVKVTDVELAYLVLLLVFPPQELKPSLIPLTREGGGGAIAI